MQTFRDLEMKIFPLLHSVVTGLSIVVLSCGIVHVQIYIISMVFHLFSNYAVEEEKEHFHKNQSHLQSQVEESQQKASKTNFIPMSILQ